MSTNPGESTVNSAASDATSQQTVVFRMGEETYGIDIFRVHEIIRLREITPIPKTGSHIRGLVNLRGNTIQVIDLSVRLCLEQSTETDSSRIIVVESEHGNIGIIVDAVSEVITLEPNQIEDTPHLISDGSNEFVKAVAKRDNNLIALLDLDKTLAE